MLSPPKNPGRSYITHPKPTENPLSIAFPPLPAPLPLPQDSARFLVRCPNFLESFRGWQCQLKEAASSAPNQLQGRTGPAGKGSGWSGERSSQLHPCFCWSFRAHPAPRGWFFLGQCRGGALMGSVLPARDQCGLEAPLGPGLFKG